MFCWRRAADALVDQPASMQLESSPSAALSPDRIEVTEIKRNRYGDKGYKPTGHKNSLVLPLYEMLRNEPQESRAGGNGSRML